MGQLGNLSEFMLVARASGASERFSERVRQALRIAATTFPAISWKMEFDVGEGEHVEVFTASSHEEALRLSRQVSQVAGVRTQVLPLTRGLA